MSGGSVLWAEAPDEDGNDQTPDSEAPGDVDDSFAARRLRRWLRGMFGGQPKDEAAEPEGDEPGRGSEP